MKLPNNIEFHALHNCQAINILMFLSGYDLLRIDNRKQTSTYCSQAYIRSWNPCFTRAQIIAIFKRNSRVRSMAICLNFSIKLYPWLVL
uniref:Uncharacterized protein n=1 Tax=Arundo donax TaxID=35708 RepID=A0A0A9EU24_ARUDO